MNINRYVHSYVLNLGKLSDWINGKYLVFLQVKYKQEYEKSKGKVIGIKSVSEDSQMAHSALATKLQSDRYYKKDYEDAKTRYK